MVRGPAKASFWVIGGRKGDLTPMRSEKGISVRDDNRKIFGGNLRKHARLHTPRGEKWIGASTTEWLRGKHQIGSERGRVGVVKDGRERERKMEMGGVGGGREKIGREEEGERREA